MLNVFIHWDREKVGRWGRDRDRQRPIIVGLKTGTDNLPIFRSLKLKYTIYGCFKIFFLFLLTK